MFLLEKRLCTTDSGTPCLLVPICRREGLSGPLANRKRALLVGFQQACGQPDPNGILLRTVRKCSNPFLVVI